MFNKAKTTFEERLIQVTKWEDVVPTLDNKCIVVLPWCEVGDCEDDIKARSKRSAFGFRGRIFFFFWANACGFVAVLSKLMRGLLRLVPSPLRFRLTRLDGTPSFPVRPSARRAARMQSAGPCSAGRTDVFLALINGFFWLLCIWGECIPL